METQEIIKGLIDKIAAGDNVGAQDDFSALISTRVSDALEARKQELAASVYNGGKQEEEETTTEATPEVNNDDNG